METKTYWVGDRPGGSWMFTVLDQNSGTPFNLAGFTSAQAILLDSDNREYVFPDANVSVSNPGAGEVSVLWPTESLFTRPGRYVMQLKFSNAGSTRKTTVQEILVRQTGGVTK